MWKVKKSRFFFLGGGGGELRYCAGSVQHEKNNTNVYVSTIEVYFQNLLIHFWYFWEKQVSLTEFIHVSMGKQNFIKSGFNRFGKWARQF